VSSRSWEKSCYDAVAQLRILLDNNDFTFANIITIMKQLDLDKRPAKRAQVPAKFTSAAQRHSKARECEKGGNLDAAPETSTIETNNVLLTESSKQTNKNDPAPQEMEVDSMQIVDAVMHSSFQRTDIYDTITRSFASLDANVANEEASIISSSHSLQFSMTNFTSLGSFNSNVTRMKSFTESICHEIEDPLLHVRASFAASSQKETALPETINMKQTQCEATLRSNLTTNSIASSSAISCTSSQSHGYYDYCLSQKEFDITLPSQSTPSDIARITARAKEAKIFRQIEGSSFDEKAFFDSIQMPSAMSLTPPNDEDVMSSM